MFSTEKLLLSQNRKAMSQQPFEALVLLEYNHRLCDVNLVGDAIAKSRVTFEKIG